MTSRDYFKGKRIAVIGLGIHGEMVNDVKFLIKAGALVSIYDLKSEARLKTHLVFLRSLGLANYVCGTIPPDDLLDMEIIILSHEYPRDSSFLSVVKKSEKKIQIEYPETLFFKLAPPVTVVGIMGSCGKSSVMSILTPMLESVCEDFDNQGFFTIDPESNGGIISNLRTIKNGDIVLVRVVMEMMSELYALRISPQVAVFTTLPPRNFYSQTPLEVLSYQTYNNYIIGNDEVIDAIRLLKTQPKSKMLRTKSSLIPSDWQFGGRGSHDRENAALALQTARLFKVDDDLARITLEKWKSLKGRLEFVKKVKNIEFYNDSASVSVESTKVAIETLSVEKNVILIFGGAKSSSDYNSLYGLLPKYVRAVVLLPGSGTMVERNVISKIEGVEFRSAPSLDEAARMALECAQKGDKVIFSPGFEAVGFDNSRKERGDRFVRAVKAL